MIGGKKILDLSRIIVGPNATQILSDFGCDVIKIQSPQGDPARKWGPPWLGDDSTYFLSVNRNKRSLVLNLKEQRCREVFYRLVSSSDAVVENFIPGTTAALKIDYQTVRRYNPSIVYCSVSGFGDIGSKAKEPAFDNLIQAEAGFMHLTGDGGGQPYKLGFAVVDVLTSLYVSNAILAALLRREQTKEGTHLKTSLYECAVASLINQGSNYLNGGINPQRIGNMHQNIVPYGVYSTKTLPIVICVGTKQQYINLIEALEIQAKEKYQTNELRIKYRQQFDEILNDALKRYTMEEAVKLIQSYKVPCGRVNDLKSLFEGKTVKQLELVQEINNVKYVRNPIRCEENKKIKNTAPPSLNEHGKQILQQLGYNEKQMDQILNLSKKSQ